VVQVDRREQGHVHREVLRADAGGGHAPQRFHRHPPDGAVGWCGGRRLRGPRGNSTTFETHLILTGADRYGVENLANLDRIPRRGATIVVGLIPYEEGSGGQARVFASW
jgi:kynurenine formamidase